MAIEYKTFKVRIGRRSVPHCVDSKIESLRKLGWHVRSVWGNTKEGVWITAWRDE